MAYFLVAEDLCSGCGACVKDCPPKILALTGGHPDVIEGKEASCYHCQHCLAVCPSGAITVGTAAPGNSRPLAGHLPDPDQLETLIKGRRSVRQYRREDVDPATIDHLLEVAWHAPTGVNARSVHFTLVDNLARMDRLRADTIAKIKERIRDNRLPPELGFFADFVPAYENAGVDVIYRGAPHLVIASAHKGAPAGLQDCLIALSTFDLFAQANGLGTVWAGLAAGLFKNLAPEMARDLGIPDDHQVAYAMLFGKPAVHYQRTVQHGQPPILRVP